VPAGFGDVETGRVELGVAETEGCEIRAFAAGVGDGGEPRQRVDVGVGLGPTSGGVELANPFERDGRESR
jgi:hypothetical protein